ncbi:MAG: divalent-cation tolerance protein CutA [Spirochaetaceae bacterium]|nr:divalent-cation tolerance protein CutA [Myxococcales bacterium]MCB9725642.1 divalent-cation tolerance protein CutA [Spirochaetaceae bacterium]HPG24502.1 divalent-cation tolerance protein CutA [Myxococcota bacterium]
MKQSATKVLFSTCGADQADDLARTLVEERVVACVNAIPGAVSHYWWQGSVQRDEEVVLVMETTAERLSRAMERLRALHAYEVPKIVVLDPEDVDPDYACWLRDVLA